VWVNACECERERESERQGNFLAAGHKFLQRRKEKRKSE